jgi:hypothetical protein
MARFVTLTDTSGEEWRINLDHVIAFKGDDRGTLVRFSTDDTLTLTITPAELQRVIIGSGAAQTWGPPGK